MASGNSDVMIFPKEDDLHADRRVIRYDLHIVSMAQVTTGMSAIHMINKLYC
jgi:hypothetical protein